MSDYLWREFQGEKLASLFGLDQAASQGNETFQFTAPRQPKRSSSILGPPPQKSAPPPGTPSILLATAVQAFRFVNGQYMKQGKVGAAILGSHLFREYNILLYGSQQKQITTAKIHSGFVFTVQPGNYGTFYDDQRQNWSLMFDSEKAGMDFCKEVCVAKRNSEPTLETLVTQDLAMGEGQTVACGDTVEVAFTGWLLQNHHIGQIFDSNLGKDKLLRVKLGAGKAIKGLEEGMLGMQKSGRRLLIVPPSLGYGSKGMPNLVPPTSTLIFDLEIRRVKFAKDVVSECVSIGSAANSPSPSVDSLGPEVACQPPTSIPAEPGGQPLRVKSNSINEQLMLSFGQQNPDASKAKLISRMAKMGQPMLPFLPGTIPAQPDPNDSEKEYPSESHTRMPPSPTLSSHPSPQPVQMSAAPPSCAAPSYPVPGVAAPAAAQQPVYMETAAPQAVNYGNTHAFQLYPHLQCSVGPFVPPHAMSYQVPSDVTSFLMTEARQHTTEIRLAIGKVADKMDLLASKVDTLQKHSGCNSLGLSSMSMETAMIMHNIQRIVQENVFLKKEVLEKSSHIEEQNWKIGELIEQNQRHMEQSSLLLEQRSDELKTSNHQSQTRLLQAEQDKVCLAEELASSSSLASQLHQKASSLQLTVSELTAQLSAALQDRENHCTHISSLEKQVEELKEGVETAQAQWRTEKQKRRETDLRVTNMEEELQDLRSEKDNLDQILSDRKRKWDLERQRVAEELEEVRSSGHRETESLWVQLRRARSQAERGDREQLQSEMEAEWQGRCDRALSLAREKHCCELTEMTQQRDTLERTLTQLQEQQVERKLAKQANQETMAEQVKRLMNTVFHSLRGEFDLHGSYQGGFVLGIILRTLKGVTLEVLTANDREEDDGKSTQVVLQNGKRAEDDDDDGEEEEEEKEEYELCQTVQRKDGGVVQTIDSKGPENKPIDTQGRNNFYPNRTNQ